MAYRIEVYVPEKNAWFCNQRTLKRAGNALKLAESWAFHHALRVRVVDIQANEVIREYRG